MLLDTHALVWWATGDARLSAAALDVLQDETNSRHLSVMVAIETAWLQTVGRIDLRGTIDDLIDPLALTPMNISFDVHRVASRLPPIHGDPIDRLLVAQAQREDMTLVTRDRYIRRYQVPTVW